MILNKSDVQFDVSGRCTLKATRPKVNNNIRTLRLEKTISTSPVHKSIKNYLEYIRPKFASKSEKAFFVDPWTRKRWTEDKLRTFLTRYAKKVYPNYYPYIMRHWCATARMIEWKNNEWALTRVCYWLGHDSLDQTKMYVDLTQLFNDNNGSWLSRALKRDSFGGLHGSESSRRAAQHRQKRAFVEQNPSCNEIRTHGG